MTTTSIDGHVCHSSCACARIHAALDVIDAAGWTDEQLAEFATALEYVAR